MTTNHGPTRPPEFWEAVTKVPNFNAEPHRPIFPHADRDRSEPPVLPPLVCPECAQGKHGICAGEALDPVTDEVVGCQCPEDC